MVKIYWDNRKTLYLYAEGHAGAGKKGEDPVCAGISTLLFTLEETLRQVQTVGFSHLEPGYAEFCIEKTSETDPLFSFTLTGLHMLAAVYPEYLCLTNFPEAERKAKSQTAR